MDNLSELRKKIDAVDDEICEVLSRRFALTDIVREYKRKVGLPAKDESREREIFMRVMARTPIKDRDTVYGIYERIFGGSRGEIEVIARGVLIRNDEILLCRAKGKNSTYLPGGHIEFGESGAQALEREILEEMGLNAKAGEMIGVVENEFEQDGKHHCEINLVYQMEMMDIRNPQSMEDWIEFEFCPLNKLSEYNLLPAKMMDFVK